MKILRNAWVLLLTAAAISVIACSSSSSSSSTSISCVLEGDSGSVCLCSFDVPAAGAQVVKDCSTAAYKGTTCCASNGWPSNASGDAICECTTFGSGCTTQVASCSAGTAPKDGG